MLNIEELKTGIENEKIEDQLIKTWLLGNPRLIDEEAIRLLIKHRPELSRQLLQEFLVIYAEKVTGINTRT